MKDDTSPAQGKNWSGENLNADNLNSGVTVRYDGELYQTGNRRNTLVELYKEGKIVHLVDMSEIYLVATE